jgi:hypothetical protein
MRYVVFHSPGPRWKHGIDFREENGVGEHVQHYLKFLEQGKLELFAASDLAVKAGLLVYEIRPWLTAMEHE